MSDLPPPPKSPNAGHVARRIEHGASTTTGGGSSPSVTTNAPTSEPVPDGEIIEVIKQGIKEKLGLFIDGYDGDGCDIYQIAGIDEAAVKTLSALRSHYHITIKRKE